MCRRGTRTTQLRGVDIAAGDPMLLLYEAANRDEDEFGTDADEFDVSRDPNHEVAVWASGPHFCLGATLAGIEIKAMLEALLDGFTELEPAGEVERTASFVIAGISHRAGRVSLIEITPHGSAYRGNSVQLDLPVLKGRTGLASGRQTASSTMIILFAGDIDIAGRQGGRRTDVFDGPATTVYFPPGSSIDVTTTARTELALASTVGAELTTPTDAEAGRSWHPARS